MKKIISFAFAAAMLTAPGWVATPAQAMTMEECLAAHSAGYCEAALSTESIASTGHDTDYCKAKTTLVTVLCV